MNEQHMDVLASTKAFEKRRPGCKANGCVYTALCGMQHVQTYVSNT